MQKNPKNFTCGSGEKVWINEQRTGGYFIEPSLSGSNEWWQNNHVKTVN